LRQEWTSARVWHTNHPLANDDYTDAYRRALSRQPPAKPGNSAVRLTSLENRLGKAGDWDVELIKETLASKDSADHPVCVPTGKRGAFTFASTVMVLRPDAPELQIAPGPPDTTKYEVLGFAKR
jgi:hypothetical protein